MQIIFTCRNPVTFKKLGVTIQTRGSCSADSKKSTKSEALYVRQIEVNDLPQS